jgi:peptide subunit release factor 1 (eRF1)
MINDIDLRELAKASSKDRSFLSLYLSGPGSWEKLGRRMQTIETILAGSPAELAEYKENLKKVRGFLERSPHGEGSLCVFCCQLLDYFKSFSLERPVKDLIRIGPSPYVRPIAELREDYESIAVVAASNDRTRIFLVTAASAKQEEVIKGGIKNHVKVGGWSQQRYERRRDKALHHYAREVVERLARLEREEPFRHILLVGSKETLQEIARNLPPSLAAKLTGEKPLDLSRGEGYLHQEVLELFDEQEHRSEAELWRKIQGRYSRGEPAAIGPEETLEAALAGRVETAVANRGARVAGTRCRDCDRVYAGCLDRCPACGSTSVYAVDLVNELVERLALTGASLEFVGPLEELKSVGELAALLRY